MLPGAFGALRAPGVLPDSASSGPDPETPYAKRLPRIHPGRCCACDSSAKGKREIVKYQADYIFWKPA